jgi:uncharacterized protein
MNPGSRPTRIGIISDTHGLLRPEAVAALRGVELIIHAGDVGGSAGVDGKAEILRALEAVAPVVAVRGNVDTEAWGRELRETEVVEITAPGKEISGFRIGASHEQRMNAIRKSKIHRRDALRLRSGQAEGAEAARRNLSEMKSAPREMGAAIIYVLHNLDELDLDPAAAGFQMVVSGHSHKPSQTEKGGVIYLNPGSAGPRRFRLPVTLTRLDLGVTPWRIEFVDLENRK